MSERPPGADSNVSELHLRPILPSTPHEDVLAEHVEEPPEGYAAARDLSRDGEVPPPWNTREGREAAGDLIQGGDGVAAAATSIPVKREFPWNGGTICTEPKVNSAGASGGWNYTDQVAGTTVWYVWPPSPESSARAFAAGVRASIPMFLPYRNTDVTAGGGWLYGNGNGHAAIDYGRTSYPANQDPGWPVYAVASGVVVTVVWDDLAGNVVVIEHTAPNGNRYRSLYLHVRNGFDHDLKMAKAMVVQENEETNPDGTASRKLRYSRFAKLSNPSQLLWGTNSQTIRVKVGDNVSAGQHIAWSGNTGFGGAGWGLKEDGTPNDPNSANNHLHLFMAVPGGNASTWTLLDPYGVYNRVNTPAGEQCYDLGDRTAYVRLFAPFYSSFHNVPIGHLLQYWGYYTGMGMALRAVSTHRFGNQVLASGSFQHGFPSTWSARLYVTTDQFVAAFTDLNAKGFRPRQLGVTIHTDGSPRFSAIWKKLEGEDARTWINMSDASFDQKWKELVQGQQFRVDDHAVYEVQGQRRHAAIFVKGGGSGFFLWQLMTSEQFQAKFNEMTTKGFMMESINVAELTGGLRYSGVWRPAAAPTVTFYGMTPEGYQQKFNELSNQGFRLYQIQGYANSSRFAAIWRK